MNAPKTFAPWTITNPRAHSRGPFGLRYAGGRPRGEYATVADAVAVGRVGERVVTLDGWWMQGYIVEAKS